MVYDPIVKRISGTGIRFQMFAALNTLMVILVTGFLFYDYHGDRATRLTSVRTALNEEARLLWLGASHLSGPDPDLIQVFVDDALTQLHRTHDSEHIVFIGAEDREYLAATAGISESHLSKFRRQFSNSGEPASGESHAAFMTGIHRGNGQTAVIAEDQDAIES